MTFGQFFELIGPNQFWISRGNILLIKRSPGLKHRYDCHFENLVLGLGTAEHGSRPKQLSDQISRHNFDIRRIIQ